MDTFHKALAAAKKAGVKKVTITIDVDGFTAPVELAPQTPVAVQLHVGDSFRTLHGKDPLGTLAQALAVHQAQPVHAALPKTTPPPERETASELELDNPPDSEEG